MDRAQVCSHGFSGTELGLAWWHENLPEAAFEFRFDDSDPPRLTRGVIFGLAEDGFADTASDDDILGLLWHVLAWGSGTSRRHNLRRIQAFVDNEARAARVRLLREAGLAARQGATRDAYSSLIRFGGGVIPGLGPSFFTKFLYFAGGGAVDHRAPILDARVATSLHHLGWSELPPGYFNWYTATYVSYSELLERWAVELATELGREVGIDEIEYVLFRGSSEFAKGQRPSWIATTD